MKTFIFNIFFLMTVVPSLWVAFSSNIVHAAFSLLFTFFGVAGLYVLLGADFIGVIQVLVYISGILVLIIFGVMMTQRGEIESLSVGLPGRIFAGIMCLGLLLGLSLAAYSIRWPQTLSFEESETTSEAIGSLLLGKYLVPFEVVSVLLLVVLVGAVLIVRLSIKAQ